MPFCPKCRYEFVKGVKKCPDCGTELVDKLPEEQPVSIKWVPVGTLQSSLYGDMAKELLEKNGIPALLITDFFHGALTTTGTSMPGSYAKIFVPEEKTFQARELLKNYVDIDLE